MARGLRLMRVIAGGGCLEGLLGKATVSEGGSSSALIPGLAPLRGLAREDGGECLRAVGRR